MKRTRFQNIRCEVEEQIALLTIDRLKALNSLNRETFGGLEDAFAEIREESGVGAVILTGAGEKAFVSGADIRELDGLGGSLQAREHALRGQEVLNSIENFPKPVIAAINGFALGGGCELALACHIRIAADGARLGQPEVKLGIVPGYGGTQRLTRLVGKGRALELLLTGEMVSAAQALEMGLVNRVVSRKELIPSCRRLAESILANAPLAVKYSMEAVHVGYDMPLVEALLFEATLFGLSFGTQDQREGFQAFFEKREPHFRGK